MGVRPHLAGPLAHPAWGTFARMLEYKLVERGGYLLLVPAHHSSQTCAACRHVDAANRPDRDTFRCVRCGHSDHADVNAARVILLRGPATQAA